MNILTIGNSFSTNATEQMLNFIEGADNVNMTIGRADLGGCSLEKHWNLVEQCDLIPGVKPYHFEILGVDDKIPMTLREILTSRQWNYVTLQQVSHQSWRRDTFTPFLNNLYELVKELAPQATPLLHQTWAYRIDNYDYFTENNINQEKMFTLIKDNYKYFSEALGCRVLPSGAAIQKARKFMNFQPDNNFDFENPVYDNLPEQSKSLIIGYKWRTGNTATGKAELGFDPIHLNDKGCYIANAVWFEMLTGKSVFDNKYSPDFLTAEELEKFKQIAHETVAEYGGYL